MLLLVGGWGELALCSVCVCSVCEERRLRAQRLYTYKWVGAVGVVSEVEGGWFTTTTNLDAQFLLQLELLLLCLWVTVGMIRENAFN